MMPESDLHVLYLTKECNIRCTYCYQGEYKKDENMSVEKVIEDIDLIMASVPLDTRAKILLFGGEPFLNWKGIQAAMERAQMYVNQGRTIIMSITTNGTLMTKRRIKEILKYKHFMDIHVSIDGNKESQDKFRIYASGHGSHDMAAKNVKYMLRYFPWAQCRMVIADVDNFYNNFVYLAGLGFKSFCIQALRNNDGTYQTKQYHETFATQLAQIEEFMKTKNHVKIQEIQHPQSAENNDRMRHKADQTNSMYKYFLPDGGQVHQKTFTDHDFQHFTKGAAAEYNLFNKDKKQEASEA